MSKGQAKPREKNRGPGRSPGAGNRPPRQPMLGTDQGISPADVLLGSMRYYWAEAHDESLDDNYRARAMDKAVEFARQAAPYVHVEHSVEDGETLWELSEKQDDSDEHDLPVGPRGEAALTPWVAR